MTNELPNHHGQDGSTELGTQIRVDAPSILIPRYEIRSPYEGLVPEEVYGDALRLVHEAQEDAFERSSGSRGSLDRIHNATERRFFPYVLESGSIAAQLNTSEYKDFANETSQFLDCKIGFYQCPDGRIISFFLFDPRVASISRNLQGLTGTRPSTKNEHHVLNDPDLSAAVKSEIIIRKEAGENPELVEFGGPHIHSLSPEHGCGACIGKMRAQGRTPEIGMRHGGLKEYYDELGEGFYAFNNAVDEVGGTSTTIDLVHDASSQGFIIGLREAHKKFVPELSLRENLSRLADQGEILMTELLDDAYRQRILGMADRMGIQYPLDFNDFKNFGKNAISVGRIARELTQMEEKREFDFIPTKIKSGYTEAALRASAYHSLRNCVARVVGNERPGARAHHPEKLIRIGPIGADFNIENIPFVISTPSGLTRPEDMGALRALYDLSYGVMRDQGINLELEGRIIISTGAYDPDRYPDRRVLLEEYYERMGMVKNNAAWIRLDYKESVASGETIVLGGLYTPATRRLTHIV